MDAGRAVSPFFQQDQELANMICADLVDIQDGKIGTEMGEGVEFLGIEFEGASGQVAGSAGVQVDHDPFSQIVGLVFIQCLNLVLRDNRFHSVFTSSFPIQWSLDCLTHSRSAGQASRLSGSNRGYPVRVVNFSISLQAELSVNCCLIY